MPAAPKTPDPDGYASVAKRIAGWTTKGLLSALVLIAGVGFGREVLILWRGGDVSEQRSSAASPIDPGQPHTVTFGEAAWSIRRREIGGDITNAVAELRKECVGLLRDVKPRPLVAQNNEHVGVAVKLPPQRSEAATDGGLMKLLSNLSPVADSSDGWQLYEFNESFPMVVGVARTAASSPEPETESADLAQFGYEVIMWGIAIPTGADRWSICVFLPNDFSAKEEAVAVDVPLPPGARRTLAVRKVEGEAIVAFAGRGEVDRWRLFLDEWFAEHGWKAEVPWRRTGDVWYAEYVSTDYGGRKVEVHFGRDAGGGLSGLLMIAPPTQR